MPVDNERKVLQHDGEIVLIDLQNNRAPQRKRVWGTTIPAF